MVSVDDARCRLVAGELVAASVPKASEDSPLVDVSPAHLPNFYLFGVAICHQTSPRNGPRLGGRLECQSRDAWGWDYLRLRLAERVAQDAAPLEPSKWTRIDAATLSRLFADANGSETLSAVEERIALIRDLGTRMCSQGIDDVTAIFVQEQRTLENHGTGILPRLSQFDAYRDPIRKKSFFFLELMQNSCGWSFVDPHHLGAPVDYHEVRGHLRLGTVIVEDRGLLERVRAGIAVDAAADVAIRGAVANAIALIASMSGHSASDLHYLFWNVFRNCCSRSVQHCSSCTPDCGLPSRYRATFSEENRCMFRDCCRSANLPHKLLEHVHETDFY